MNSTLKAAAVNTTHGPPGLLRFRSFYTDPSSFKTLSHVFNSYKYVGNLYLFTHTRNTPDYTPKKCMYFTLTKDHMCTYAQFLHLEASLRKDTYATHSH